MKNKRKTVLSEVVLPSGLRCTPVVTEYRAGTEYRTDVTVVRLYVNCGIFGRKKRVAECKYSGGFSVYEYDYDDPDYVRYVRYAIEEYVLSVRSNRIVERRLSEFTVWSIKSPFNGGER